MLCVILLTGLGLWAREWVHPRAQRSEPGGSGPRPVRTCIHGHSLHLCWRRERMPNPVSKPLRGDSQGGRGARTGHRHHPRLRPWFSPNQVSQSTEEWCRNNHLPHNHHSLCSCTFFFFLQIFPSGRHKEILFNREVFWWTEDCAGLGQRREQHVHNGGHCSGWK